MRGLLVIMAVAIGLASAAHAEEGERTLKQVNEEYSVALCKSIVTLHNEVDYWTVWTEFAENLGLVEERAGLAKPFEVTFTERVRNHPDLPGLKAAMAAVETPLRHVKMGSRECRFNVARGIVKNLDDLYTTGLVEEVTVFRDAFSNLMDAAYEMYDPYSI